MKFLATLLLVWPYNFAVAQSVFEPATKISYTVRSAVVAVPIPRGQTNFQYTYELTSSSSSIQNIWTIDIRATTSSVLGMSGPSGWSVGASARGTISWGGIVSARQIRPGTGLAGYSLVSINPPDIVDMFAQGYVPLPPAVQFVDETTPAPPDPEQDSVHTLAIGPSTFTFTDPSSAIDRLISLKHQSASLGWLGNAKFVLKLDKRLDQAKAALVRDKKKLARVRLSQFVHELTKAHDEHEGENRDKHDDDRGKDRDDYEDKKFANDEAFQLLKINADFIIAKLPATAKDKDEEDECRSAEGEKDDEHDDGGKKDKGRDGEKQHDR